MSPIKSQLGNLAAGLGAEAVAAVKSIADAVVPPAINTIRPIDGKTLNVSREARRQQVNVAVSSVYSLGGQNAALVFRKI